MTQQEIRDGFNQMIQAALAAGDHTAVAHLEVAREYLTNGAFKQALQDHLWAVTQASMPKEPVR